MATVQKHKKKALRESVANEIYVDVFTGTKTDRPEFDKLMDKDTRRRVSDCHRMEQICKGDDTGE